MKKNVFVTLACLVLTFIGGAAHAQLTVFDPAQYGQQIQQVASWKKQFTQMKDQFDAQKRQFDSMNGSRGMASLVNNPQLRGYLPSNYQSILNGGYGNSADIRAQYRRNNIGNTTLNPTSDAAQMYEQSGTQAAVNRATAEEGYRQASNRFASIQVLLDKVNDSPDPKAIADLQARIQAEQAMLQNESIKLQMMSQLAQAQKDLQIQQGMEVRMKSTRGEVPRF